MLNFCRVSFWTRSGTVWIRSATFTFVISPVGNGPYRLKELIINTACDSASGGSSGNADFVQSAGVTTRTDGGLGELGTRSTSFQSGRANNAAITSGLAGSVATQQNVRNVGIGGWSSGIRRTNMNLGTSGGVGSQAAVSGTGSFESNNDVRTRAGTRNWRV